jgi:hypothetical protein
MLQGRFGLAFPTADLIVEHQFSRNLFVTSLKSVAIMIFCFGLISRLFMNTKFHVVFMHWLWYFVLVCFSLHNAMLRKTFLLVWGSCCVYALVVGFFFALILSIHHVILRFFANVSFMLCLGICGWLFSLLFYLTSTVNLNHRNCLFFCDMFV